MFATVDIYFSQKILISQVSDVLALSYENLKTESKLESNMLTNLFSLSIIWV